MKIGVFTVSTPEYTPVEAVEVIKALGYDGVEWRVTDPSPNEKPVDYTYETRYWSYNKCTLPIQNIMNAAKEVKTKCEKEGLEIYSLTSYVTPWETDAIKNVLAAAAEIGCLNIRVNAPVFDGRKNYCTLFDEVKDQLKVLEKMAALYRVRINIEQHMNTIIPSASAAYRLVSSYDPINIGIILDPGNMVYEGFEDYRIAVQMLGQYIACVHIKNGGWLQTGTNEYGAYTWKPAWMPLKKGYVDFIALVDALRQEGYCGYLGVEDFSNELETGNKLQENIKYIREILG